MGRLVCSIGRRPRNCWVAGGKMLLIALVLFVVGAVMSTSRSAAVSNSGMAIFTFASLLGLAAVIVAFVGLCYRAAARVAQKCLDEFEKGKFMVHWVLTADDVAAGAEVQYRRSRKNALIYFWVTAGIGALVFGAIGAALCADNVKLGLSVMIPGILGMVVLAGLIYSLCMMRARHKRDHTLAAAGEIYIAPEGGYFSGDFVAWATNHRHLSQIRLVEGTPAVLELTIHWSMGAWAWLFVLLALAGGRVIVTETDEKRVIAVPAGHETEAQALVAYFNQA
jgi:hypothetical protein